MSCGIYKITNLINNKAYVGFSKNIEGRFKTHKRKSSWRSRPNKVLYKAFIKYGLDNFKFEIIEECCEEMLAKREIYYIDKFGTFVNGYNRTEGGEGVRVSSTTNINLYFKNKLNRILRDIPNSRKMYVCRDRIFRTMAEAKSYGCLYDTDVKVYDKTNTDHMYIYLKNKKEALQCLNDEAFYLSSNEDFTFAEHNLSICVELCSVNLLLNDLEISDELFNEIEMEGSDCDEWELYEQNQDD